jgi:hypothetical protein
MLTTGARAKSAIIVSPPAQSGDPTVRFESVPV